MAVILFRGRHSHYVETAAVQPFHAALRHKIVGVIAEQPYHNAVRAMRIFIICAIKTVLLYVKLFLFHFCTAFFIFCKTMMFILH